MAAILSRVVVPEQEHGPAQAPSGSTAPATSLQSLGKVGASRTRTTLRRRSLGHRHRPLQVPVSSAAGNPAFTTRLRSGASPQLATSNSA